MRKKSFRVICIPVAALSLFARLASADDAITTAPPTAQATSTALSEAAPASCEADPSEDVGTAAEPLTDAQRTAMCQAAILVASSLGCAAVTVSCAATEVLTVGAVTIPCVLVAAFACAGQAGGAGIIAYYCPAYVNK